MIVYSELFEGKVYFVDANGNAWRVGMDYEWQPIIHKVGDIGQDSIKRLCGPRLVNHFRIEP